MVVEDEHLCVVVCGHRRGFVFVLRFTEEEERAEEDGEDGEDRPKLPSADDFFDVHALPPFIGVYCTENCARNQGGN